MSVIKLGSKDVEIKSLPLLSIGEDDFFLPVKQLFDSISLDNLNDPKISTEVEFRLGLPKSINDNSKKWDFSSSMPENVFHNLKNNLSQYILPKVVNSEVYINNEYRKIKTTDDGKTHFIYQKKYKTDKPVDTMFYAQPYNQPLNFPNIFILRFSKAQEETLSEADYNYMIENVNAQTLIRNRQRYEFDFIQFNIDLTIVDNKQYEIELELKQNFFSSLDKTKIKEKNYILSKLFIPVKFLLKECFSVFSKLDESNNQAKVREINFVTSSYLEMYEDIVKKIPDFMKTGGKIREQRPINISEKKVPVLYDGYSFTNKLNGIKYRLVITNAYFGFQTNEKNLRPIMILINDTDIRYICSYNFNNQNDPINKFLSDNIGTIIDLEYFEKNNKIGLYAFDCILFKNKNVSMYSHDKRLSSIYQSDFIKQFNITIGKFIQFKVKPFFYTPGDPILDLTRCLQYMKETYGEDLEKDNDGIIMTPEGSYYNNETNKVVSKGYFKDKFKIYKWKFPQTVSIDFLIKKIDEFEKYGETYIVYSLYTVDKTPNGQFELKEFGPFKKDEKWYNPPSVYMISKVENDKIALTNDLIVEFTFDKNTNSFVIYKIRHDKTKPNAYFVAKDTFIDMDVEFSLQKLFELLEKVKQPGFIETSEPPQKQDKTKKPDKSGCLINYREYHNAIKKALINNYTSQKYVLDLGAGKGGDLGKYFFAKIAHLWAIEPNEQYVKYDEDSFVERLKKYDITFKSKVEVLISKAEDTQKISNFIKNSISRQKIPDVICSFFSISFFFKDQKILDNFINTINSNLQTGGLFIGTMMDGERLYTDLETNNGKIIQPNCFEINRNYQKDKNLDIGMEISIDYKTTATVKDVQIEWLAPFNILKDMLLKNNIQLVDTGFMDDSEIYKSLPLVNEKLFTYLNNLSPEEKQLNKYYRYFVFIKIPQPSKETEIIQKVDTQTIKPINTLSMLKEGYSEKGNYLEGFKGSIYRTGVLEDGSCFFHSLLYLIYQNEYKSLTTANKQIRTASFRNLLADLVDIEMISKLGSGQLEIIETSLEIKNLVNKFPSLDNRKFDEIITSSMAMKNSSEQLEFIINNLRQLNSEESLITNIRNEIINVRKNFVIHFKNRLSTFVKYADYSIIEYVMRVLPINIFIINDTHLKVTKFCSETLYNPSKLSIVLINLQDAEHYEPISEFYSDEKQNIYQITLFRWDHPLIKFLYSYVHTTI